MCIYFYLRLRGTAIRIEDNVIVTEHGCEIINKDCPETVKEISALMQRT